MRNWSDVLPEPIAIQQHAYERAQQVARMRAVGLTNKQIEERTGISVKRISLFIAKASRQAERLSPIEKYFASSGSIAGLL